jgi:hypothetical protein
MNTADRQKFKEHLAKQKSELVNKIHEETNRVITGRDKSRVPELIKILEGIQRQLVKLEIVK